MRSGRWRFLLILIDHLPAHSFFIEARVNDPEVAAAIAAQGNDGPSSPSLAEFGPVVRELTFISDRLSELVTLTARSKRPVRYRPRPVTAIDAARRRFRKEAHDRLTARLLPNRK